MTECIKHLRKKKESSYNHDQEIFTHAPTLKTNTTNHKQYKTDTANVCDWLLTKNKKKKEKQFIKIFERKKIEK